MNKREREDLAEALARQFDISVFQIWKGQDERGFAALHIEVANIPNADVIRRLPRGHEDYPVEYYASGSDRRIKIECVNL